MNYERCGRCEINYKPVGEPYCEVCRREIKGERYYEDEEDTVLCPYCGIRKISCGEEACRYCLSCGEAASYKS